MRATSCIMALGVLLAGCSQEIEEHQGVDEPAADTSLQLKPVDPTDRWAADLIAGAKGWEPVTAEAVPAHVMNFGLCRLPIPGVDDHGPHGASLSHFLATKDPEARPKAPANQFIVNPIGRGHFYHDPDLGDAFASKPTEPLPVGTVIIKEKYLQIEDANRRTNPHSFGVMIKHEPGYDPEHGDWEYAYIEVGADSRITDSTRGKLATCIDCHANRKQNDYVFRKYPLMAKPR